MEDTVLVVDLDDTLVRTDMLFETFWSSVSRDWRVLLAAASTLPKGRAPLKRLLADASRIDAGQLPYNQRVIAYIRNWRASGGRTALVTASDQTLADRIAQHLDLFDEVYGSDGEHNLKGRHKAAFLAARYGEGKFAYLGDHIADLPVWARAGRAITIDVPGALAAKVERLGIPAEHLTSHPRSIRPYLRQLRPQQWLKNVLIFVPILAAHQFDAATLMQGLLAFIAFCAVASSVYVVNDLLDLSADRAHPTKSRRPFASGAIPMTHSLWLALAPLAVGLAVGAALGTGFLAVMVFYYLLTFAYSLWLKRIVIVDICVLAGLYTLRIFAGSAATSITISDWLLEFSLFFFLALATVKRHAELVDCAASGKVTAAGRGYHVSDLPVVSQLGLAAGLVSVMVLALFFHSPSVVQDYKSPKILWGTSGVLLYWLARVHMITHRGGMNDDPIVFAIKDKISWLCLLAIILFVVAALLT
jgi:4-hydroxybenzoate polyprenyltransferase/phosphoserine phosphatase